MGSFQALSQEMAIRRDILTKIYRFFFSIVVFGGEKGHWGTKELSTCGGHVCHKTSSHETIHPALWIRVQ